MISVGMAGATNMLSDASCNQRKNTLTEGQSKVPPSSWADFFATLEAAEVPPDFLDQTERAHESRDRNPFHGWRE